MGEEEIGRSFPAGRFVVKKKVLNISNFVTLISIGFGSITSSIPTHKIYNENKVVLIGNVQHNDFRIIKLSER
jgi:hypothetical protein